MSLTMSSTLTLNNNLKMPVLGYGTALISEKEQATVDAVLCAIEAGYRHIDTATIYLNEAAVGKAIRQSGVPREQFFITTKLWNEDMRKGRPMEAFEESLNKLQLDYVDMYMLHWPVPMKYLKCWAVLEKIYQSGKCRAIGVSNFNINQLQNLLTVCHVIPTVNQCEFHPRFARPELRAFCAREHILYEAYRPLGNGAYAHDPTIARIAEKQKKSFAQVIVRWCLQHGVSAIPKSAHADYIKSNAQVFDFELDAEDMLTLDRMDINKSVGTSTPECFDF